MTGKIFELREERLPKEDWINESDFYEVDNKFFDWVETANDEARAEFLIELKNALPASMFKMEGDEITVISDGKEVVEEWIEKIKRMANELTYQSVTTFPTLNQLRYKLKGMVHEDFKFQTDYADYAHDSTEFVKDCIANYQGKKLYVCGIVIYHF